MNYNFKCDCGNNITVQCEMKEISKKEIICSKCGRRMKRVWKSSFIIPEHMKSENSAEMSYLNNIMKNRPSGKRKILY